MAQIDFSDVVNSVEFNDPFLVLRTIETVNPLGRAVETPQWYQASGVVTPGASADDLVQLPDGTRSADALSVVTTFPLRIVTATDEADIVVWRDAKWRVHTVIDFGHWGSGFVRALCVRQALP